MKAGYGKSLLTPRLGVELAGYGYYLERRAERALDDLHARAVCIEDEGKQYFIVSCDLLGLNTQIADQVRRAAGSPTILVSVHTHTGPAMINHEGCGVPDEETVAAMADRIIMALSDARDNLHTVVNAQWRSAPVERKISYNRALPDGPEDRMARALILRCEGARDIALYSYACHAVSRWRIPDISADYPGRVCALLEDEGVDPIYLNGLCGDIDPVKNVTSEELAQTIIGTLNAASPEPCEMSVSAREIPCSVRSRVLSRKKISEIADAAKDDIPGARKVAAVWKDEQLAKYDSIMDADSFPARCLRLCGHTIVALPWEGYTEIGQRMREKSGEDLIVLGCADQLLGYLPTKEDIERSGYAAMNSVFGYRRLPVLPGEAERLGDELGEALRG